MGPQVARSTDSFSPPHHQSSVVSNSTTEMFGKDKKKDQSPRLVELQSDRSSSQSAGYDSGKDDSAKDVEQVEHVDVVVIAPSSRIRSVSVPSPVSSSSVDDRQAGQDGQSGQDGTNGEDQTSAQTSFDWHSLFKSKKSDGQHQAPEQEQSGWRSLFKSKTSSEPPVDKQAANQSRLHQIIRILGMVWTVVRFCYNCYQNQQRKKERKREKTQPGQDLGACEN